MCLHGALWSIPFNLICNMTTFRRRKKVLTFYPTTGVEGVYKPEYVLAWCSMPHSLLIWYATVYKLDAYMISPEPRLRLIPLNMCKPSVYFLLTLAKGYFFCGSFLLFIVHACLCYIVLSVSCNLGITLLGKGCPLGSLVCCIFLCVVTFTYDFPSHVWYLILLYTYER